MKKVVSTFISGDYDSLKDPKVVTPGWEYVCFTNNPDLKSNIWSIEIVKDRLSDKKLSRKYKIENQFKDYDLWLYIDGSFQITQDIDLFSSFDNGIWLNEHPMRDCIYDESRIVIKKNLDSREVVENQVDRYRSEGFPENFGMWRCGVMIRNPKQTDELCNTWWEEVSNGSWRDQISFPYACWKTNTSPNALFHGLTTNFFEQSLHSPRPLGDFKIVHIPLILEDYDGTIINQHIQEVSDSDWVLLSLKYEDYNKKVRENPNTHLFAKDYTLLFPKWLHHYFPLQARANQKRRFDQEMVHLTKLFNGIVRNL